MKGHPEATGVWPIQGRPTRREAAGARGVEDTSEGIPSDLETLWKLNTVMKADNAKNKNKT